LPGAGLDAARGGLAIKFGLSFTDERQWMTPVKSFIWAEDAAGIREECIEMRNRVGEGCWGVICGGSDAGVGWVAGYPRSTVREIREAAESCRQR
jgi:hypothetical protein